MKMNKEILAKMIFRYPALESCRDDIENAVSTIINSYTSGGKLLVCGNGGSAADAEHIVGELMKGFRKPRKLGDELRNLLIKADEKTGTYLADKLQGALPAISLNSHPSLRSAFINDVDADLVFAQQVLGYGKKGDILLGISTSGNAQNVYNAFFLARTLGIRTIGLTGKTGGRFKDICELLIRVPEEETYLVQELHLPVYHAICAYVEDFFF
jgi:D-sedoheptulose 7-phosphate isomerase